MYTNITELEGLDLAIMDSAEKADRMIELMVECFNAGESDVEYYVDDLTPYDAGRVDTAYYEIFGCGEED